jgi:fluoroquinolone resistance protein
MEIYSTDKNYDQNHLLLKGEYERCTFKNINLVNSDLTNYRFIDCIFIECDLSLAKIYKTTFRDIVFKNCKMLGLRFDTCNALGLSFSFEGCQLNHSSFYKTKIKRMAFADSQLIETDFSEADLTSVRFENSNLEGAMFDRTILETADLRSSYNYSIDPEFNRIKGAKFSITGVAGLLDKYNIVIE